MKNPLPKNNPVRSKEEEKPEKVFDTTDGDARRGVLCGKIYKMEDAALEKVELFLSWIQP